MTSVKKVKVALLALVAALVIVVPTAAFADLVPVTAGSIAITVAEDSHQYEAYQVFDGDVAKDTENNNALTISNVKYGSGVKDVAAGENADLTAAIAAITLEGGAKPFAGVKSAADVAAKLKDIANDSEALNAFADVVATYLSDTKTTLSTKTSAVDPETGETKYTFSSNITDPGYYFVKDADNSLTGNKAYTNFILQLVGDVAINAKSDKPEVTKEVLEDNTGTYGKDAVWQTADPISYRITGTLPSNYATFDGYFYKFTDTMDKGLTLDETSIKVYAVKGQNRTLLDASSYAVGVDKTNPTYTNGTNLTITFYNLQAATANGAAAAIDADTSIVVEYTCTLNENCVVGNNGNPNDVQLKYANNPNKEGHGTPDGDEPDTGETEWDHCIVFTFQLDTTKVDAQNEATTLEGAKFKLYRMNGTTKEYAVIDEATQKITGWNATGTEFTTPAGGQYIIKGLDGYKKTWQVDSEGNKIEGSETLVGDAIKTYYLEETKAPTGYQLLADPIVITISSEYDQMTYDGTNPGAVIADLDITTQLGSAAAVDGTGTVATGNVAHKVGNTKGGGLPSTGGIGTTIFTIVGIALIVAAAAIMVIRRRNAAAVQ